MTTPGATAEQLAAVRAWPVKEFSPARDVPATHLLPKVMPTTSHRPGTYLPRD